LVTYLSIKELKSEKCPVHPDRISVLCRRGNRASKELKGNDMGKKITDSRILIVDDTLKNIQLLGTILKNEGYNINVAQDGLKALKMVEAANPDLILLDIMMPELDGFETCKRLKTSEKNKDISHRKS
jgi:PleD family two-component response regulator